MLQILFLDLATRTGWCAGSGKELPAVGHIDLAPAVNGARGRMFLELRRFLLVKIKELAQGGAKVVVGFEQPLLPKPFLKNGRIISPTNINTTLTLQGLAAIAEEVCEELRQSGLDIDCCCEDVGAIKRELAGTGKADKDAMVFAARKVGLTIAVHDEADAFGGFLCVLRHYDRAASREFDRVLWSSRGALL